MNIDSGKPSDSAMNANFEPISAKSLQSNSSLSLWRVYRKNY